MRKLFVAVAAVIILLLLVAPSTAAPKGGTAVTGTIELDTSMARLADDSAWPSYGDSIGFQTEVEGRMGPKSGVYVTVVCTQAGHVVYQWSAGVAFSFPLEDQPGLDWDGDLADCSGTLIYYEEGGKSPLIVALDQTTFTSQVA